jgi:hypothetical protein
LDLISVHNFFVRKLIFSHAHDKFILSCFSFPTQFSVLWQRFNRDDNRHSDDRRDRRRSHDDNIYGSTSGAGILGAAPSRNDRPSMNSGLRVISSNSCRIYM